MKIKECRTCGKFKKVERFRLAEGNTDGLTLDCRKCFNLKTVVSVKKSKALGVYLQAYKDSKELKMSTRKPLTFGSKDEAYYTEKEMLNGLPKYTYNELSQSEKLIYLNQK